MRKPANEADRVRHEISPPLVLEAAGCRVERLEEAVVNGRAGSGQRVEKRRLADIRVTRQGHGRRLRARSRLAASRTLLAEIDEPSLEERDPPASQAAVGLELALPRAAGSDAPAQPLEVLPQPPHARQVVLQLRELDLELALGADGVLGEDVEDQLRAVDDAGRELVLEQALLGRAELVVDEQRFGAGVGECALELDELALADIAPLVDALAALNELADGLDSRGAQKLAELAQLLLGVDTGAKHGDDESPLGLCPRSGIRLALCHD